MGSGISKLLDPLQTFATTQVQNSGTEGTTQTRDLGIAPGGTQATTAGGDVSEAGASAQSAQKKKRLGTKSAQIKLDTGISQGGGTGFGGV